MIKVTFNSLLLSFLSLLLNADKGSVSNNKCITGFNDVNDSCRLFVINIGTTIGSNPIITAKQNNNKTIRSDDLIVLEVPSLILSNNYGYYK